LQEFLFAGDWKNSRPGKIYLPKQEEKSGLQKMKKIVIFYCC